MTLGELCLPLLGGQFTHSQEPTSLNHECPSVQGLSDKATDMASWPFISSIQIKKIKSYAFPRELYL